MSTLFSCCLHQKMYRSPGADPLVGGQKETKPTKGWNTFSFWTCNKSRKFACFLMFKNAKSHIYLCCLAKRTFNKSHLAMCMVIRRHFITIKIFPEAQLGARAKARCSCPSASLPPLTPPMGGRPHNVSLPDRCIFLVLILSCMWYYDIMALVIK